VLKKGLPILLGGIGLVLVLVALPLLGACTPKEVTSPTGEPKEFIEFTVEGFEFEFSPATITVSQGDEVKITFNNVGEITHVFVIDEFEVETPVLIDGQTATVEFTADKAGTFAFYCSLATPFGENEFGVHRELGMEGKITVN
jgi:cytochrome c oxidase subunit 2